MSHFQLIKRIFCCVLLLAGAGVVQAATVAGTAQIAGGPYSLNLQYSDNTSPVSINNFSSILGPAYSGTVLGAVQVFGADDGTFNLYQYGQGTHANQAQFHFSEVITNSTSFDQQLQMNFLINAGAIGTSVHEIVPKPDEFLEAGYDIAVSFAGTTRFSSGAKLRQVGTSDTTTTATLTQSGTTLGGTLDHYQLFAPDSWQYQWNAYNGILDLGVLAAGASATLEYDVTAFGSGVFCGAGCGNTIVNIGDPLHLSSIGGPNSIVASTAAVPEPDSIALLVAGLGLLGFLARRRHHRAA